MTSYNTIRIVTILLLTSLANHAIATGVWMTDTNGCKLWDANPKQNEIVTWSGACAAGYAEGPGTVQWLVDGEPVSKFEGSFSGGKRNGKGIATNVKGDRFEGEFVDDLREGNGIIVFADGSRYEGDFVDGKRTGKGVITFKNGNRYEGDFVDGKLTGKGLYTWADGTRYVGDMTDGKLNGKGSMKFASGDYYEGDFINGKRTGKGAYKWATGNRYEGEFVDGKQDGKGTTHFTNGDRYEGSYSNGLFNGEGKMQYVAGSRYEGSWKAGKYDGVGTIFYANGTRHDGVFPSGVMVVTKGAVLNDSPASLNASRCAPSYSQDAFEAKEEGTVRLQFQIGADGKLLQAAIDASTGFADLDQAALEALSRCAFKPAIKDGKPAATTLLVDYVWKAIPPKASPIVAQLKGDEGLVLIDVKIVLSNNEDHPAALDYGPHPTGEADQVWLKNIETHKIYDGMFNLKRGAIGVALVVVPEGLYCLESFSRGAQDYSYCQGQSIRVNKGVINNAGEWQFARYKTFSLGRAPFELVSAQENRPAVFQRAVNQHPELFEN